MNFNNWLYYLRSKDYEKFSQDHKNKYDIVVKVDSLLDLKSGWSVTYPLLDEFKKCNDWSNSVFANIIKPNEDQKLMENAAFFKAKEDIVSKKRSVVSILGLYNRGKSYILARIFGLDLSSSYFAHTEGLSIVTSRASITDVLIGLDTKGSQKPVPKGDDFKIKDAEATERFLQSLSLSMSDIVLIVVNRLTRDDQSYIKQVKQRFNKKSIIIVHNLSHVNTIKELDGVINEELIKCFECTEHKILDQSKYWTSLDGTRHVVMAKDEMVKDPQTQHLKKAENAGLTYNKLTIELLRSWLTSSASTNHAHSDLIVDIVDYTKKVIGSYLEIKSDKFKTSITPLPLSNKEDCGSAKSTPSSSPNLQSSKDIINNNNNNDNNNFKSDSQDSPLTNIKLVSDENSGIIRFDPPINEELKYADIRFNMVGIISEINSTTNARVEEDGNHYYVSLDCTGFLQNDINFHFENTDGGSKIKVTTNKMREFQSKGNEIHNDFNKQLIRPLEWSYIFPSPIKQRTKNDLKGCVKLEHGILEIKLTKYKTEDEGDDVDIFA
ncbi:hypothetical protein PPL_02150 [Heterostelium album PN500]|uniref:G domain-containing protein n=1 Tax=Heterostelium pallidum (strain ATCC 26659 / Pp 5 / PN500) TaxID=670386 RepID=D3B1H7_HETP5|nr:hypothetical protein PPL_02150 [Heterostelium album PN500]EFA85151.1 hypothetical protein PPL_02150 [Heterostelium album PN500]|eukprot:XP_020437260.1 hypothetical protein PPL_02150 [Heterostelium album PN500]